MGLLDDTAVFAAVIQQGGFSHAAKFLGLSNGMISRRIAHLEASLGVTLLKRTTRQIQLTPEGEVFWQHAQRIQQEMDAAVSLVQSYAKKPHGMIRVSAPMYFGRHYLTPLIMKFLANFPDINIDLVLTNRRLDPIKEQIDLVIRGAGYIEDTKMADSSLQMKVLLSEKIGLYASPAYLLEAGEPKSPAELPQFATVSYADNLQTLESEKWRYQLGGKSAVIALQPKFSCNDIESGLIACAAGCGIGRFTDLNVKSMLQSQKLRPVLADVDWGGYHLHAVYPQQKSLPRRTRLLLDFIIAHTQHLTEKIS